MSPNDQNLVNPGSAGVPTGVKPRVCAGRTGLLGLLLWCTAAAGAGAAPRLFVTRQDMAGIRERIAAEPRHQRLWDELHGAAQAYCTPGAPGFADPAIVDAAPDGLRVQVAGHHYGRRLSRWVETLGFAYLVTGEERFARHAATLLATASRKLPVTDPRMANSFAGARGDLLRGLAVGYDWVGDAMTPAQRTVVEAAGAAYVRNLLDEAGRDKTWWVPSHNFVGVAVGASGCFALLLERSRGAEARAWVDQSRDAVRRWFSEGFDAQGAYFEGTTYCSYGLSNAVLFADALKRCRGEDLFDHPHLRRVPQFFALSLLPGERVCDARNDAPYSGVDVTMLRLAGAYRDGLARWLWDRTGSGYTAFAILWDNTVAAKSPVESGTPTALHFRGRGLCVSRTGWEQSDVMFAIEAGPFYRITHNQADKGHFTLYGQGQRWAIDSGYGNTQEPEGRAQTVAHSCVLVDGVGQALSGAGLGTNGRIVAFVPGTTHDYVLADCTEAYNRNSSGRGGAIVERALRHTLFVRPAVGRPAYAVVLDDICKDAAAHEYTWLMHSGARMQVELLRDGALLRPRGARGGAYVTTPHGTTGTGECAWQITVREPCGVALWARVRVAGELAGKSDSFYVHVDRQPAVAWHMPGRRHWGWGRITDGATPKTVEFDLTPGMHSVRFTTRERDAQVDCVAVTAADVAGEPDQPGRAMFLLEAEGGRVTAPMTVLNEEEYGDTRLRLVLNAAGPVAMSLDHYDAHPRLAGAVHAVAPEFVALLFPLPAAVAEPGVTVTRGTGECEVAVQWSQCRDVIRWPAAAPRRVKFESAQAR